MKEKVEEILSELNLKENPYFVNLENGSFEKQDFVETQVQFYSAVIFFNRPMSALAAKIPHPQLRLEILKNIWEEHGEGNLDKAHSNTFLTFLDRMAGLQPEEVYKRALWPEVRIFNTCLSGACVLDDYMVGVSMMGMIERMFCEISATIGKAIVQRGWLTKNNLIHYDLHAELDVKHAADFFDVVGQSYKESEDNRYYIEQGLGLGPACLMVFTEVFTPTEKDAWEDSTLGLIPASKCLQ